MYSSEIVAFVATLTHIIAFLLYNKSTFQGKAHPNIATWSIWGVVSLLNFCSYLSMSGDWIKSLMPAASSLLCIATFIIAVVVGRHDRAGRYDVAALIIGLTAVFVWWWLNSATHANLLLQVSIAIGFVPTYNSVWREPKNEAPLPWFLWGSAYVIGTSVVLLRWHNQWQDLVYYISCIFLHLGVGALAIRRESRIKNQTERRIP